jgi:FixJ family two-component response regulator
VSQPTIYLVDDEPSVLKSLARLLCSAHFHVESFASAGEFLARHQSDAPGCLVLDVSMPGLSGLELQQWLSQADNPLPIIFITGHGDIPTSVQAMKAGAVDFLTKPVDESKLLKAIREALCQGEEDRATRTELAATRQRLDDLTPREREVLEHVVSGKLNKEIAADLGTAEHTIKVHRARVMQKMGVGSLAELVRQAERAGIGCAAPATAPRYPAAQPQPRFPMATSQ